MFRYRDFVVEDNIVCKGNDVRRYLLRVEFDCDINKKVLVILKNPSKADKHESDLTIDRVLKYCNNQGYSEVSIMNLYSYYATDAHELRTLIQGKEISKAVGKKNDMYLRQEVKKVDDVIAAWGENTFGCTKQYKARIKEVVEIIKVKPIYYVQSISKNEWYPRHAQTWKINQNISQYKWKCKKILKA